MDVKSLLFANLMLVAMATTLAPKKCCFPDQFESIDGKVVGTTSAGKGVAVSANYQLAFDYTNQRLAEFAYIEDQGELTKFQYIVDYAKGVEYIIQIASIVSACSKGKLPPQATMLHCIPDDAIYTGSLYYGDRQINVDVFKFSSQTEPLAGNITLSVTKGECIPFNSVVTGQLYDVPTLFVDSFSNYTNGIRDPSKYFTVPDLCPKSFSNETTRYVTPFVRIL
ncbi:development-specific protein LVN1.2-like [Acanthaster planci]|uniref:Development-specific protein LVN1.2-like n=1 Tax=Acanthaster planci TaxID=133434 RepID=A0A8B7ZB22_ACAPL|nr:development-specific protein LVN1.2-like [Acanthaster planci]